MHSNIESGNNAFLAAEVGIAIIALLMAFALPGFGKRFFTPIEECIRSLAKRPIRGKLLILQGALANEPRSRSSQSRFELAAALDWRMLSCL